MNVQTAKPKSTNSWAWNILPPSAIRTRTGFIFFLGISILILSTVAVTVWVNTLINQDKKRAALLSTLLSEVMDVDVLTPEKRLEIDHAIALLLNGGEWIRIDGSSFEFPSEGDENMIRILHRDYGSNARIVAVADHSGSIEDPNGLNQEELLRLVGLPMKDYSGTYRTRTDFR